jgi:WD40 repeat protein
LTDEEGSICLLDTSTGQQSFQTNGETPFPAAGAFSPDSRTFAWADPEGTIHLRSLDHGREMKQFSSCHTWVSGISFAPDGKRLATTGVDAAVRIWDVNTGQELGRFDGQHALGNPVCFSPDGNRIAAGGAENTILVWDLTTKKEVQRLKQVHNDTESGFSGLAFLGFAPDGGTLVSGPNQAWGQGRRESIKVWDLKTGKVMCEHAAAYTAAALSADLKTIIQTTRSGSVSVRQIATDKEVASLKRRRQVTEAVALSADAKTAAFADDLGTISVWRIGDGAPYNTTPAPAGEPLLIAFIERGRRLFTGYEDGSARFWEPRSGKEVGQLDWNFECSRAMALAADNTTLAWAKIGVWSSGITLGQVGKTKDFKVLASGGSSREVSHAHFLAFSPDVRYVAAAERFGAGVDIWETNTGKHRKRLGADKSERPIRLDHRLQALWFCRDGNTLILAEDDRINLGLGKVHFWDVCAGKERRSFELASATKAIACSGDDKFLAAAVEDGSVRLYDMAGSEVGRLAAYKNPPTALLFSEDCRTLAGGCHDGTIVVWEMATREPRSVLKGAQSVNRLAFSPDGRLLASGGRDGSVLAWDLTTLMPDGQFPTRLATAAEMQVLWDELSQSSASRGCAAVWKLIAFGNDTVQFLRKRVHRAVSVNPDLIEGYISELNDNRYDVRKRATEELQKIGAAAAPALRRALQNRPTAELRQRATQLLQGVASAGTPEELRIVRTLEALERIATPAAIDVLKDLAQGLPEARLTQDAKASLARLQKR